MNKEKIKTGIIIGTLVLMIVVVAFFKKRPEYVLHKLEKPVPVLAYAKSKKWPVDYYKTGNICRPLSSNSEKVSIPDTVLEYIVLGTITVKGSVFYVYQAGDVRIFEESDAAELVMMLQEFYNKGVPPPEGMLNDMARILRGRSLKPGQ